MIKDEMVYVDKTAFQKEIKKRGLTFVGVSCGLGRGKTYIRDHVCREGTLPKKDVQFIHKVFGINPNKYVTGEYDTATKRLNYALARVEDRALISRDKIVTALKNAGVTLVKASKDLGFSHAYINGLFRSDNPTAPVSMVEKFTELYGVDIRVTPPVAEDSSTLVTQDDTEPVASENEVTQDNISTEELRDAVQKTLDVIRKKTMCVDRSIVLDMSKLIEEAVYNGVKRALNE